MMSFIVEPTNFFFEVFRKILFFFEFFWRTSIFEYSYFLSYFLKANLLKRLCVLNCFNFWQSTKRNKSQDLRIIFWNLKKNVSPQVGLEPTAYRLTADRSTTELLRNKGRFDLLEFNSRSQPVNNMSPKLLS